jgi:hypothetical protein
MENSADIYVFVFGRKGLKTGNRKNSEVAV